MERRGSRAEGKRRQGNREEGKDCGRRIEKTKVDMGSERRGGGSRTEGRGRKGAGGGGGGGRAGPECFNT